MTLPADTIKVPPIDRTHSETDCEEMLVAMQEASNRFYRMAQVTHCHPFIEFTGLMNEFVNVCRDAHEQGIDFTETSIHGTRALPFKPNHVKYLAEKLGCIYGNSLTVALFEEVLAPSGLGIEPTSLRDLLAVSMLAVRAKITIERLRQIRELAVTGQVMLDMCAPEVVRVEMTKQFEAIVRVASELLA